MSDENSTTARWQVTIDYAAIDPARARAIEEARERLALPKVEQPIVWRLPKVAPAPEPAGPFQVLLDGKVIAERGTLAEAARVALSLKGCTVRRGGRSWVREELRNVE